MPYKNFLKLAGLVVLIFFLISFLAFGVTSCEAIKKTLQSRVKDAQATSETGKDIPDDTNSASSSSSTDKATSDTTYNTTSDSVSESSNTLGDSGVTNADQENNNTGSTDAVSSSSAAE